MIRRCFLQNDNPKHLKNKRKVEGAGPMTSGGYLMWGHKIFTTPIVHDEFKGVRITPNVYTTTKELERFCEVMETVALKGLPKD